MTGWVLRMLELPRQSEEVVIDRDRSDPQPPLFRTGSRRPEITPWRNSEILNRRIRTIPRSDLTQTGRELLSSPAWRLEGPLGCGKTYFAHQLLLNAKIPRLWLRGEPKHRRTGSFAQQIVEQISATTAHDPHSPLLPRHTGSGFVSWPPAVGRDGGIEELSGLLAGLAAGIDGTFYLVVDDLEQCSPGDLQILSQMASLQEVGRAFRLLLIGRTGISLPDALESLPTLGVEPFTDQEMNQFSPQLFAGLSLPTSMQDRLHVATHGCPFALEEAMIALIREQTLRRVYGGFFFAGQETTEFSPSPRLLAHLQAEAYRVGVEIPVHLLSWWSQGCPRRSSAIPPRRLDIRHPRTGIDMPNPLGCSSSPNSLGSGSQLHLSRIRRSFRLWSRARLGSGLALSHRQDPGGGQQRRQGPVGGLSSLARHSGGDGTPARSPEHPYAARIPRAALLEILTQELFRHREREGDSETELQLLWKLLPLARKLGQLNEYTSDLERGVELAADQPRRLLALAGLKAEMDQDAGRYKEAEATIQMALEAAKGPTTDVRLFC